MKIQIHQTAALHEQGGRFKNEDFVYPVLDGAQLDERLPGAIPNVEGLFMVCDGIGGENKGEIASQLAVSQFARYFETFPPSGQVTYGYLSAALLRVEEAFSNHVQKHPESRGMGTTLSMLYLDKYGATLAWIGNSRIYHYRQGKQLFKSRDHSLINDLIAQGKVTPEEAHSHQQRNVLLRSIKGTEEPTDLDLHFIPSDEIQPGDFFFLCSDGVLEEVNDSELNTLFGSDIGAEEIRQEIFSLCKGSTSDNFSFYLVQTGPLEAGAAAAGIPAVGAVEEGLNLSPEDASQEEHYSIEETMVFDEPEKESPEGTEESRTIFDRLGEKKETSSSSTVFDKIQQGENPDPSGELKKEPSEKKEGDQPPPKEPEGIGRIFWPVALIAMGFVLIMAAIWYFGNRADSDFVRYTQEARESIEAGNFDRAISLADSAFNLAEDDALQKEANKLREEALGRKKQALQTLLAKADYHKDEGGYPGYFMAKKYYQQALANFSDVADTENIQALIADCDAALAKVPKQQSVEQLLGAAQLLCQKGHEEEAEAYLGEATLLADNASLTQKVEKAKQECQTLIASHKASQSEMASREMSAADAGDRATGPATSADAEPSEIGDLADLQAASSQPKAREPLSRGEATSGSSTASSTSRAASGSGTATPAIQAGPAGGFMATRDGSPPPTDAQLKLLEKGKALYYQSRGTQSKYEEKKAAEYLKKSGPALDGEGYYLLAELYNAGWGLERDEKKVLNYAMKSSGLGYPDGSFLYATLLLARENRIDSNNAKEALNYAASVGHEPSLSKLQEMQFMLGSQ